MIKRFLKGKGKVKLYCIFSIVCILILSTTCLNAAQENNSSTDSKNNQANINRPTGWSEKTHEKGDGDYTTVFPDDKVNRIDIDMTADNFKKITDDLAKLNMQSTQDPIYVPVTVKFNNVTWQKVGFRYKGQSTLFSGNFGNFGGGNFGGGNFGNFGNFGGNQPVANQQQARPQNTANQPVVAQSNNQKISKLPFRLNFDKLDKEYPEIEGQKFYGFSEVTFGNNYSDPSFMKDRVCSEIFRDGGVPTAKSAFCRVYINTGSGAVYWGLYNMSEDVSDKMIKSQFGDDSGNCYKPEKNGADWSNPFQQSAFVKKSNEDKQDWSDVKSAHTALHASKTNAATWRANLEKSLNVKRFIRWLAINTAVVNWDSYGMMAQNYYLYQDVKNDGALVWIPWDFNMSMTNQAMMGRPLSLSLSEVTNKWPLIRYIMDDPVYKNLYYNEVQKAKNGCLTPSKISAKVQKYQSLIKPYVVGTDGEKSGYTFLRNGETEFNNACNSIITHINTRQTEVDNFLKTVTITPVN